MSDFPQVAAPRPATYRPCGPGTTAIGMPSPVWPRMLRRSNWLIPTIACAWRSRSRWRSSRGLDSGASAAVSTATASVPFLDRTPPVAASAPPHPARIGGETSPYSSPFDGSYEPLPDTSGNPGGMRVIVARADRDSGARSPWLFHLALFGGPKPVRPHHRGNGYYYLWDRGDHRH